MINDNIHPIDPTDFRIPTETEEAISETLKLCGVSGEDASMMFIEVMEKLGKNDNFSACCRSRDKNKLRSTLGRCDYCNEDSDGYVKPIEKNCHAFVRFGMNGWELSLQAKGWHGSAKIRYCPMCGRDLLVK